MTASLVKISAAMARLPFTQCGPACIAHGCKGNCCDAPTRKSGCLVTIHPSEEAKITKHRVWGKDGPNKPAVPVAVIDGLLQPPPGCRGCPFKDAEGLCTLHGGPDKPFGCIASPFTVNPHRTLIIRNRYKMLPCYRGNGPKAPAYQVFRDSLVLIFGEAETQRITAHFDAGGGDLHVPMEASILEMLNDNDTIKKAAVQPRKRKPRKLKPRAVVKTIFDAIRGGYGRLFTARK